MPARTKGGTFRAWTEEEWAEIDGKVPTDKELYDDVASRVWKLLHNEAIPYEEKRPYMLAILRWQGKLDHADEGRMAELRKLMTKKQTA